MKDRIKTLKQKAEYIWDYYKIRVIGVCLGMVAFICILMQTVGIHKDTCLQVTLVNADSVTVNESSLFDIYEKTYCDPKYEKVEIESFLQIKPGIGGNLTGSSYQVLCAKFLAGEIDLFLSDRKTFEYLATTDCFADLQKVLPKEKIEKYRRYFIYGTNKKTGKSYPVGISLAGCSKLTKAKFYQGEAAAGIGSISSNPKNAVKMLDYLFEDSKN
jgi:hypothetical protein